MINLRNGSNIELAKLRSTEDLRKRLPLNNVVLEPKLDGRRYSLQMGGAGCFVTSRGREQKAHGVAVSSGRPFVTQKSEEWMEDLSSALKKKVVLLDGELISQGISTASDAGRNDLDKDYTVFDLLSMGKKDLRETSLTERRHITEDIFEVKIASHYVVQKGHLKLISQQHFETFTVEDLEEHLTKIRKGKKDGIEGFALKELHRNYDKHWYGWKIKLNDPEDGIILAANEGKCRELANVHKTGKVGSFGVGQIFIEDGEKKVKLVGWVDSSRDVDCPIEDWEQHKGKVIEFKHTGWDGKRFRSPRFVRWRDDKSSDQCFFKD